VDLKDIKLYVDDRPEQGAFRVHRDLFAARHDHGLKLNEEDVVRDVLVRHGVDAGEVFAAIEDGTALKQIRTEHEAAAGVGHVALSTEGDWLRPLAAFLRRGRRTR